MGLTFRNYDKTSDFDKISNFLVTHFQPGNKDGNWLQPAWEYMHHHPNLDETSLERIGIWEVQDKIVGVAHYEWALGEAFFQVHPDHQELKPAMLRYAIEHLRGSDENGGTYLNAFINDFDLAFSETVKRQGFVECEPYRRPLYEFSLNQIPQTIQVPDGFQLKSLADENNLNKIHRVLWRGFNHEGEPPEEGVEWRKIMQSGPNFKLELTIVAVNPQGEFVSYCGMWYEPTNKIAYVEPVATDPDYRRMGLGKAVVLEGIRRCGVLGATSAYVGSDLPFYKAIGFSKTHISKCWTRKF